MMNFLDYPNDVARGFNIWHMPIWYEMTSSSGKKTTSKKYSQSILMMTPEPDFSMPFNINAVTHAFFGILFVNTVFFLSKDQTKPDEEEKKSKEV